MVASHVGEYRFKGKVAGSWDDKTHMNYGERVAPEMIEAALKMADPEERFRFQTVPQFKKPNAVIKVL